MKCSDLAPGIANKGIKGLLFAGLLILTSLAAHAATKVPRGAVRITAATELRPIQVKYKSKRINLFCSGAQPGVRKRINRKMMFVPLSARINFTSAKLTKKQKNEVIALARKKCEVPPPGSDPGPGPGPSPDPTPDPTPDPVSVGEEFAGPFASWRNVKTHYGAKGDGVADDTAAIQLGLDDLRLHQNSVVLYFPAGTYRITNTIRTQRTAHTESYGIAIIGENPANTIIRWDGATGGTLLRYNAWYSKISRLTLDGAGKANTLLYWGDSFSTYNETSDMVFQDAQIGMQMGGSADGQAENSVLRATFRRLSTAGIRTSNYNSMDIWVWDSLFEDCGNGLFNQAGNFHAFRNLFLRSKNGDIRSDNLMAFSFIDNVSIGSKHFIDLNSGHSWGSPTSITGNRIIEPTGDFGIRLGNAGPYYVADNKIKTRAGVTAAAMRMTWGEQTLVGNSYTINNPVSRQGRYRELDEKIVAASSISSAPLVLPPTPPKRNRQIFEIAAGANAATIQAAINQAEALKGSRPVVHLAKGHYSIGTTLVVPALSDVQIIGDGSTETATHLDWTGANNLPLFRLRGPSRAVIRDISIDGGEATGILVDNADQEGGQIFTSQLNVGSGNDATGLLVNGIEKSDVFLQNLQGGANGTQVWVRIIGGPNQQARLSTPGQVTMVGGATGSAENFYIVEKGGKLVTRAVYHETSGAGPQPILLKDQGTLSIDGTRFSIQSSATTPTFAFHNFDGHFTMLSAMNLPVGTESILWFNISGMGGRANVLAMSNQFWLNRLSDLSSDTIWRNNSSPAALGGFHLNNINTGLTGTGVTNGYASLPNRGTLSDDLLREMLAPVRESRIWTPNTVPEDASGLILHRVIISSANGIGVELRAGQ